MHRYTLERYTGRRSRVLCPQCRHKSHTLTRYIDTRTNTSVADHVGICDRKDHCGYHYPPRAFFADNPDAQARTSISTLLNDDVFDTLPLHYLTDAAKGYGHNHFITFLAKCFDINIALKMASLYNIGTSKHWPGATIFWQLDKDDKLRTGKIMLYNPADGHRVKQPYNHVTWVHTVVGRGAGGVGRGAGDLDRGLGGEDRGFGSNVAETRQHTAETTQHTTEPRQYTTENRQHPTGYRLKQCFFGEHLLNTDPFKTVAIAESEKTAVIASYFYPEYIWLAAGSLDGLNRNKCRALAGRTVILFPDVNGFDKWRLKAREMNLRYFSSNFTVDRSLARTATPGELARGIDIADRWIEQLATFNR